jgi:PPM family protein phosphatase
VDTRTAFEIMERLEWCYSQADETVKQKGHTNRFLRGMSTKLTGAYSAGDELFVVHAGQSRAYIFRAGQLQYLTTEDHVKTSETPKGPRLVSQSDRSLSSAISDTLGGSGKLKISVGRYQLKDGDMLLLCTDSLMSALGRERIADVLMERRRPDELCGTLVTAATAAKSNANITMLLAQYRIPKGLL